MTIREKTADRRAKRESRGPRTVKTFCAASGIGQIVDCGHTCRKDCSKKTGSQKMAGSAKA